VDGNVFEGWLVILTFMMLFYIYTQYEMSVIIPVGIFLCLLQFF